MSASLVCRGVMKRYGRTVALNGMDITVPKGSIFGLVGSNGAGKTTLMSVAAGLVRPCAGEVTVFGDGPFDPERHRGRLSLLPQDSRLPFYARVSDLLSYYARLQGMTGPAVGKAVRHVLEQVHLGDRAGAKIRALSHGMLRRVAVAQALLGDPELVFLDEPMSGLDPAEVANLRTLIAGRRGTQTIVISSHMLSELQNLCDQVAIIEGGRNVRQDTMSAMTMHHHRVMYLLGGERVPLDELAEHVPMATFAWDEAGHRLQAAYDGEETSGPEVNRLVLPVLLAAGCSVVEVRQGSDLEAEYFKVRPPRPGH